MMDPIKAGREIKKANKRIAVIKGQRAALVKTCNALAQAMKAKSIATNWSNSQMGPGFSNAQDSNCSGGDAP